MDRRDFLLGAMGAATMALVPGSDGVSLQSMAHPTHKTVTLGYTITSEEIEPGLYGEIAEKMAKALARSMSQTREAVAARVFLNEDSLEVIEIEADDYYKAES